MCSQDPPRSSGPVRKLMPGVDLRHAWDLEATRWIAWARAPMHDGYWRFHRDQFLELVPEPGRLTLDIGAGEGRLARDLLALGHNVVVIDAVGDMLTAARAADASDP